MKAIQIQKFGPPSVMELMDISMPSMQDDQVLIRIKAAGINPIDYKVRSGGPSIAPRLHVSFPFGLGYDFSGEIIEVGKKAAHSKKGDLVFGTVGFPSNPGCYQEYIAASPKTIALKPKSLSFEEAAALGTAATTAYQVIEKTGVKPGMHVLIHAGAGGVGHLTVQVAKAKGAYVSATASKKNHAFLRSLGVDNPIDYHKEDFIEVLKEGVDVIVDLIGKDIGKQSLQILKKDGVLISVPTAQVNLIVDEAKKQGKKALSFVQSPSREIFDQLAALTEKGQLRVQLGRTFSLQEAAYAHEELEKGHFVGKSVFSL